MKNLKKILALLLVLLLSMAVFAGCDNNENEIVNNAVDDAQDEEEKEVEKDDEEEEDKPARKENVEISIYMDNKSRGALNDYNDSPAMQELQERLGIKIDFQHPVDTIDEISLMIASGDLPDVLFTSTYSYGGWSKLSLKQAAYDGAFLKIDDYLDKMPNVKKFLKAHPDAEKQLRMYNEDGGIYAIPTAYSDVSYNYYDGYFIRQDWLDKLGLGQAEDIKTIEDWERVLTAFVEQDPNGNGVKDEVGFSTFAYMSKYVFMPAFDVFNWNYYLDPDSNEITHGAVEPGMKDFLTMICDWRERGLVNPDYTATTQEVLDDLVMNNKLGAFYCDFNNTAMKYVAANPDMELVPVPMVQNSRGQSRTAKVGKSLLSGTGAFINADSEYIEEIFKLFDYLYSEEGNTLGNWGIEGETYTVDADGNKQFTELITDNPDGKSVIDAYNYYTAAGIYGGIVALYDVEVSNQFNLNLSDKQKALYDKATQYCVEVDKSASLPAIPTTVDEDYEFLELSGELLIFVNEYWAKLMSGDVSVEEYDDFVDEVNALGMEGVLEIKQRAYERGLNKIR